MAVTESSFGLAGGIDLATPSTLAPPGSLHSGMNFVPVRDGYRKARGFERFDGRPEVSNSEYWILRYAAPTGSVSVGTTITGATSGATGVILVASTTAYHVLHSVVGTFVDGETLTNGASTASGTAVRNGAATDVLHNDYINAERTRRRALITAVPGSGPVRGVKVYAGAVYAFRDNAAGTAGVLHKATSAGWTAITLRSEIPFKNGSAAFAEGGTLTGATSGATATIRRVQKESGSYSSSTATGRLVIQPISGTFSASEALTGSTGGAAAADGAVTAQSFPPGGKYDLEVANFTGVSSTPRLYGCQGVGRAFEFDGTTVAFLKTGYTPDVPTRVEAHQNHLFAAYAGGVFANSSIGDPYQWQAITGATSFALGEDVTDIKGSVSGAMVIFGSGRVAALTGTSSANWQLQPLAANIGALAFTAQEFGRLFFVDRKGLNSADATQSYGDFKLGPLSPRAEPYFARQRAAGRSPVGAVRAQDDDGYWLFYGNGDGVYAYMGRKDAEIIPFSLGVALNCTGFGFIGDVEYLLMGGATGMVHRVNVGNDADGAPLPAFIRLSAFNAGAFNVNKRWMNLALEVTGASKANLRVYATVGYGATENPPERSSARTIRAGGGFWGEANWGELLWSSPITGTGRFKLSGVGTSVMVAVVDDGGSESYTLTTATLRYSRYGLSRREF